MNDMMYRLFKFCLDQVGLGSIMYLDCNSLMNTASTSSNRFDTSALFVSLSKKGNANEGHLLVPSLVFVGEKIFARRITSRDFSVCYSKVFSLPFSVQMFGMYQTMLEQKCLNLSLRDVYFKSLVGQTTIKR